MNRTSTRSVLATLRYYCSPTDDFSTLVCRGCREKLDISQPDSEQPDQFLGICPTCGRWHRIASSAESTGLTVVELPDIVEIIRSPSPSPDRSC